MLRLFLILGIVLLTGCANVKPTVSVSESGNLYVVDDLSITLSEDTIIHHFKSISWIKVDDVHNVCLSRGATVSLGFIIEGCAVYNDYKCVIITPHDPENHRLDIIGHEVKHCFEGQWHD